MCDSELQTGHSKNRFSALVTVMLSSIVILRFLPEREY